MVVVSRMATHRTPPRHTSWNETLRQLDPYHAVEGNQENLALLLGAEEAREVVKNRDLNIEEVLRLEPQPRRGLSRRVLLYRFRCNGISI